MVLLIFLSPLQSKAHFLLNWLLWQVLSNRKIPKGRFQKSFYRNVRKGAKGGHLPCLRMGSVKGFWNLPLSSTHVLWAMVVFNLKIFVLHSLGWPSKIRVTRALSAYGKVLVTLSPNNNGVLYEMKLWNCIETIMKSRSWNGNKGGDNNYEATWLAWKIPHLLQGTFGRVVIVPWYIGTEKFLLETVSFPFFRNNWLGMIFHTFVMWLNSCL